jgi:hypothetical protein
VYAAGLSIFGWVAFVAFVLIALLATWNVSALWRGERQTWRWSERWVRGLPLVVVIGWGFVLGALLTLMGTSLGGTAADLFALFLLLDVLLIVACALLWLSVYAFNRPRFAVPPHLRDQR